MNFLREIVSGPKNRFKEDGYNLDLTYICPRVIAMSYPASGVESVYRNPIDKVTKFIKEKHANNFLVFNLSGRMYNYSKFEDQVLEFQWEDHHSPPIHTLFQICQKMQIFLLAKKENVCIIHCLAGKGRTGTIICCFLLYSGIIATSENTLNYYSKKRFIQEGFGVNQPCQIRYLQYFHEILKNRQTNPIYPKLVYIKKVVFRGRPNFNTQKGCRPYFDLVYVRTKQLIFSTKQAYSEASKFLEGEVFEKEFVQQVGLCGDLLMRIKHNGYYKNQKIARISFNTAFVPDEGVPTKVLTFSLEELSPSNLTKDARFPKTFTIEIHFGQFCNCTRFTPFKDKCNVCAPQINKEKEYWEIMQRIVKNYYPLDKNDQRCMLFGHPTEDDIQYVLQNKSVAKAEMRNIFKFDCEQDKFVQELDNTFLKKPEGKLSADIEEVKESNSPKMKKLEYPPNQYNQEEELEEIISPVKIRKRSDVRHNFYSEDQAFQQKSQLGQLKINTNKINNNKENFNSIKTIKQIVINNGVNPVLNTTNLPNEIDYGQLEANDVGNEVIQNNIEEPPSPLSPKNSYANKNDNDTDLDSPYEDANTNLPKGTQNCSQFFKENKQSQNLLIFDKDSFEDLHNDSDDPTPQKPFLGDKIFVNNMNQQ